MIVRRSAVALFLSISAVAACSDEPEPMSPDLDVAMSLTSPRPGGPKAVPERGAIVFTKKVGYTEDIFSIDEDGSNERRLTYARQYNLLPAVSPDGRRIAYYSGDVSYALDLYVMNIDGSNPRQLAALGLDIGRISELAWSPDGRQLAAGLALGESPVEFDLYTIHSKNGALTQLTSLPGEELWPTWSPDGLTLAFAMRDGNNIVNIHMMDASGAITQYTYCTTSCRTPKWSPDGNLISWFDAELNSTVIAHVGASYAVVGTIFDGRHAVWSPDGARVALMLEGTTLATASSNGNDVTVVQVDAALGAPGGWARR